MGGGGGIISRRSFVVSFTMLAQVSVSYLYVQCVQRSVSICTFFTLIKRARLGNTSLLGYEGAILNWKRGDSPIDSWSWCLSAIARFSVWKSGKSHVTCSQSSWVVYLHRPCSVAFASSAPVSHGEVHQEQERASCCYQVLGIEIEIEIEIEGRTCIYCFLWGSREPEKPQQQRHGRRHRQHCPPGSGMHSMFRPAVATYLPGSYLSSLMTIGGCFSL